MFLKDDQGNLLDGSYSLDVKLYNSQSGGAALWSETHNVTIDNGNVNLILGSNNSLNLDFDQTFWLEITVDNGTPLDRVKLTAVPYSMRAKTVPDNSVEYNKLKDATFHNAILKFDVGTGEWEETQESDPVYNNSAASSISSNDITDWNDAYSWGDHANEGYISTGDAAGGDLTGTFPNPDIAAEVVEIDELSDAATDSESVFIGDGSGSTDDGSNKNTAVGINSLNSNTSGTNNTAVGRYAMSSNTSGSYNAALGTDALMNNNSGGGNTAIGYASQKNTTYGTSNTSVGNNSMKNNIAGSKNVAIGDDALNSNENGDNLVAVGFQALYKNASTTPITFNGGTENTALGYQALKENTTGSANTAAGFQALSTNTSYGNNSAFGYKALNGNSGSNNNAFGSEALDNTSGSGNNAFGVRALYNNTIGSENSAFGKYALRKNEGGSYNSSFGNWSMYSNTSGDENVAVGYEALRSNTKGYYNVAVGYEALRNNTNGYYNVAVGYEALESNTSGDRNSAIGYAALNSNTSGDYNVALGSTALSENTVGYYNVSLGYSSGDYSNGSHYQCTFVGRGAEFYSGESLSKITALGNKAWATDDNHVRIGNSSVTQIGGEVSWSNLSDARFKKDVKEDVPGMEFISKLRPVTFHKDVKKFNDFSGKPDSLFNNPLDIEGRKKQEAIKYTGFLAQEVEQAAEEVGYDFSGVNKPSHDGDYYGLRYAKFVVPMVKAMQQQQEIIEKQKNNIDSQENEIKELKSQLNSLNEKIEQLEKKYQELIEKVNR